MLLFEEWDETIEPTLEEQFEEALAREDARDGRPAARGMAKRSRIRLVVNNERKPLWTAR